MESVRAEREANRARQTDDTDVCCTLLHDVMGDMSGVAKGCEEDGVGEIITISSW